MAVADYECLLCLSTSSLRCPFELTLGIWHQNMPSAGPLEPGILGLGWETSSLSVVCLRLKLPGSTPKEDVCGSASFVWRVVQGPSAASASQGWRRSLTQLGIL